MNIFEAIEIVENYIYAFNMKTKNTAYGLKPSAYLQNTKDEIISAYKLYYGYAHITLIISSENLSLLDMMIRRLNIFIPAKEYFEAVSIWERTEGKKNIFSKMMYAEDNKRLVNKGADVRTNTYRGEELDSYESKISGAFEPYKRNISLEINRGDRITDHALSLYNDYCELVYNAAGIKMNDDDPEFFYPPYLQKYFSTVKSLDSLYSPYLDIINKLYDMNKSLIRQMEAESKK